MTSEIDKLKLAGYGNGEGGPNGWMYQQVIEAIAVFASHGNSGVLIIYLNVENNGKYL